MIEVKSVIVVPHKDGCKALGHVADGASPTCWNVLHVKQVTCTLDVKTLMEDVEDVEGVSHFRSFFEFACGDPSCRAKKRITSVTVANTPEDK